jgi:hypothetical protein
VQQCVADAVVTCGGSYLGTMGSLSRIQGYTCTPFLYEFGDVIAEFYSAVNQSVTMEIWMECFIILCDDFDLVVLDGACDPNMCLTYSAQGGTYDSVTFQAQAGHTYYLITENYYSSVVFLGQFDMTLTCN